MEALERNRPFLATPDGRIHRDRRAGRSGWIDPEPGPEALARGDRAAARSRRDEVPRADRGRRPAASSSRSSPTSTRSARTTWRSRAESLGSRRAARRGAASEPPLVSIVIPYYRLAHHVEATVALGARQTYPRIELLVVNDGSLPRGRRDARRARASAIASRCSPNQFRARRRSQPRGPCRRAAATCSSSTPTTCPRRPCRALRRRARADSALAYATSWARYVDEDGEPWRAPTAASARSATGPLGPTSATSPATPPRSSGAAVRPRPRLSPELTSFEDWALYRRCARSGRSGRDPRASARLPDPGQSMMREVGAPNQERIEGEIRARIKEEEMRWTAPS